MNSKIAKLKTTAVIAVILLMTSVMLMTVSFEPVQAATTYENMQEGGSIPLPSGVTPDVTVDSVAYLSFRPNPVGKDQTFLVNLWLVPASHVSRYFSDFTVTITKPDGTVDTVVMDSYRADATAWFEYPADQVGEWTLKFDFLGGFFPAGNYTTYAGAAFANTADVITSFTQTAYYKPSSTGNQTLVVQEEPVMSWADAPIPTDYWTRPASVENRNWWPILGNYPATGYNGEGIAYWDDMYPDTNPHYSSNYAFTPWVQAPNSAHIVWRQQRVITGVIGGQAGQYSPTSGSAMVTASGPGLIYSGRCYQTYTKAGVGSVAACYDLRTGDVYYEIPTSSGGVTPTIIAYVPSFATMSGLAAVPGGSAGAGWNVELLTITGGRLIKVDPYSGLVSLNVSISPLTGSGGTYYLNNFVLSVQDLGAAAGADRYRLINWTTSGNADNLAARIVSNTTYAMRSLPSVIDFNAGIGATVSSVTASSATGTPTKTTITAYDLLTGVQRWTTTVDEVMYTSGCTVADHGKVAVLMEHGYYKAWDLSTGKVAWTSEVMDYPWGSSSFGAYAVQSAYGMIYRQAYDGIYAFNWADGSIAWKYKAYTADQYETPYIDENGVGVNSFMSGAIIADGKLYTYNTEHTPSLPMTRGWKLHCVNATSGEGIWNITGPMAPSAFADGYLTAGSAYDGYLYVFGKGKSATTVEAPLTAVTLGQSVVIKGTVLDQSPAQAGTPCVSKDSMASWMEYLHMQHTIPASVTGVSVSLDALDSNNNWEHIATVTTEGLSGTFGYTWEPPIIGQYQVVASFLGDDSYGSSLATTYVTVVEPMATATPDPPQAAPDYTLAIVGTGIATIIAVALVGLLILRKR